MPYPACCKTGCEIYVSESDGTIADWTVDSGTWAYPGGSSPELENTAIGRIINNSASSDVYNVLSFDLNLTLDLNWIKVYFNYTDTNNYWEFRIKPDTIAIRGAASGNYAQKELRVGLYKKDTGTETQIEEKTTSRIWSPKTQHLTPEPLWNPWRQIRVVICTSKPEWRNDYTPGDTDLFIFCRLQVVNSVGTAIDSLNFIAKNAFHGGGGKKFGFESFGNVDLDDPVVVSEIKYNKHKVPIVDDASEDCKECSDCLLCKEWWTTGSDYPDSVADDSCTWLKQAGTIDLTQSSLTLDTGDILLLKKKSAIFFPNLHFRVKSFSGTIRIILFYVQEDAFFESTQVEWEGDCSFVEVDSTANELKGGFIRKGVEYYNEGFDWTSPIWNIMFDEDAEFSFSDRPYTYSANHYWHISPRNLDVGGIGRVGINFTALDSSDDEFIQHYLGLGIVEENANEYPIGFHQVSGSTELDKFKVTTPIVPAILTPLSPGGKYFSNFDDTNRDCNVYACGIRFGDGFAKSGDLTSSDVKVFTGGQNSLNQEQGEFLFAPADLHVEIHDKTNSVYVGPYNSTDVLNGYTGDYAIGFVFGFKNFGAYQDDDVDIVNTSKVYLYKDDSGNELFLTNFRFYSMKVTESQYNGRFYCELKDNSGEILYIYDTLAGMGVDVNSVGNAKLTEFIVQFIIFSNSKFTIYLDGYEESSPSTMRTATLHFQNFRNSLARGTAKIPLPFTPEGTAKMGATIDDFTPATDKFFFMNSFAMNKFYDGEISVHGSCGGTYLRDNSDVVTNNLPAKLTATFAGIEEPTDDFYPDLRFLNGTRQFRLSYGLLNNSFQHPGFTKAPLSGLIPYVPGLHTYVCIENDWGDWGITWNGSIRTKDVAFLSIGIAGDTNDEEHYLFLHVGVSRPAKHPLISMERYWYDELYSVPIDHTAYDYTFEFDTIFTFFDNPRDGRVVPGIFYTPAGFQNATARIQGSPY